MINDTDAMNQIKMIMSGHEWSGDTLDRIAQIMEATGRTITEPGRCGVCGGDMEDDWHDADHCRAEEAMPLRRAVRNVLVDRSFSDDYGGPDESLRHLFDTMTVANVDDSGRPDLDLSYRVVLLAGYNAAVHAVPPEI